MANIYQMVSGNIKWWAQPKQRTKMISVQSDGAYTLFSLVFMSTSLTRRRSFGLSRNLWEEDYVTSQKNVCEEGYIRTYTSKHTRTSTKDLFWRKSWRNWAKRFIYYLLVVQETNRLAKRFRYIGADRRRHGRLPMCAKYCRQSRPKLCPRMQENGVRLTLVLWSSSVKLSTLPSNTDVVLCVLWLCEKSRS